MVFLWQVSSTTTIDALSREKGIDPRIVVSAVEDAIVVATRKYYKTQENLRAELDKDTGKINAFAVRTVVETPEQVEDPLLQITLEMPARWIPRWKSAASCDSQGYRRHSGPHCRATGQAGHLSEGARGRARHGLQRIHRPRGRDRQCQVKRIEGPDLIFDLGKAESRMPRKEQSRLESFAIGERVRVVIARVEKASKGPGGGGFPRRAGFGAAPVPDRSSGNL